MATTRTVTNAAELQRAIADAVGAIEVEGTIRGMPSVTLPPGTTLVGRPGAVLRFGGRGVVMSADTTIRDLTIVTADVEIAVGLDTSARAAGTITLQRVTTQGQVALIFADALASGDVQVDGLTVVSADVRGRMQRPRGYNVEVQQGAFTLWNQQADPASLVTATLKNIAAGTDGSPVRGSGIFVAGGGFGQTGRLEVSELSTGVVVTDGGIPEQTPDVISGAVFVVSGATARLVSNLGPVTTYGQNDMVLDNWGTVGTWEARDAVTSHGPSGIGFVNFGDIEALRVRGPIVTNGVGARGYNLYDGSTGVAEFASITTHGDGAIGIQISRPSGPIHVTGDLATTGGTGMSLVKGEQVELSAIAFSVKPGGRVERLEVGGDIRTAGDDLTTVDLDGPVGAVSVGGRIVAEGVGSTPVTPPDSAAFAPFVS